MRAAEVHGDNAPSAADIDLAIRLRPFLRRDGRMLTWHDCLNEPWAAKLCRELALMARLKQAWRHRRCSRERVVAIAGLVVADHARAQHQIEGIEAIACASSADAAPEEPPELDAVIAAIEAIAGLHGTPSSARHERPLEPDTTPRRLGEVLAGFRVPDVDDPGVQRWLREMDEGGA